MELVSTGMQAEGAWKTNVEGDAFKALLAAKLRFIMVMSIVFITFYLGLSVLSGFARGFLAIKVIGSVNLGFVLIAANYVMAWIIAIVYARVSGREHDPLVDAVVAQARKAPARSGRG